MRTPMSFVDGGLAVVEATGGTITPMTLADEVRTLGALEAMRHVEAGLPLVDGRKPESFAAGTLPHASNVLRAEAADRLSDRDPCRPRAPSDDDRTPRFPIAGGFCEDRLR